MRRSRIATLAAFQATASALAALMSTYAPQKRWVAVSAELCLRRGAPAAAVGRISAPGAHPANRRRRMRDARAAGRAGCAALIRPTVYGRRGGGRDGA